jgi:hypothetical protein
MERLKYKIFLYLKYYNPMYKIYYSIIALIVTLPYGNLFAATGEVAS